MSIRWALSAPATIARGSVRGLASPSATGYYVTRRSTFRLGTPMLIGLSHPGDRWKIGLSRSARDLITCAGNWTPASSETWETSRRRLDAASAPHRRTVRRPARLPHRGARSRTYSRALASRAGIRLPIASGRLPPRSDTSSGRQLSEAERRVVLGVPTSGGSGTHVAATE